MKLVLSTTRGGLDDVVFPAFGRAPTFTEVEIENGEIKSVKIHANPGAMLPRGAGVVAAQFVANLRPDAVVTGNMGPNAYAVLSTAGIRILMGMGSVRDLAIKAERGELQDLAPAGRRGWGWRSRFY